MRAVMQRASRASVKVNGMPKDRIGKGLVVFLGIEKSDAVEDLKWLAGKIVKTRCFEDVEGRMNQSLMDIDGRLMVISQFTLFGSLKKGSRPSFNRAADPEVAIPLYEAFLKELESLTGNSVAAGEFGAYMEIEVQNDGPVTLIIDTNNKAF